MMLSELIRKRDIATATVATPATHKGAKAGTVAKVASVAVANLLFVEEELAIRAWLAYINETDPAMIADVLTQCQSDAQARAYYLEQSRKARPLLTKEADYNVTCGACKRFSRFDHPNLGHCSEGEPEAIAGLWDSDWRWCQSYNQKPDRQEESRHDNTN